MDLSRRHILTLGGASALAATLPRTGTSAADQAAIELAAQTIAGPAAGSSKRLGYSKDGRSPVLRVAQGSTVRVRLKNDLPEPTAIDWHGLRRSNGLEVIPGFIGTPVGPGLTTMLDVTPYESGTAWFHPPFVPGWSDQTSRGLAGVLVVEDANPPMVEDDIVLFITDHAGVEGSTLADRLLVNGTTIPETRTSAAGSRLRLRLVNGSTRYALSATLNGALGMVIAIDGQPSELFRPLNDTLPIGPGARFDLLVDVPNARKDDGPAFRLTVSEAAGGSQSGSLPVLLVMTHAGKAADHPPMAALTPNPALPREIRLEQAFRTELSVQGTQVTGFSINGTVTKELAKAPLFSVKRNSAVSLGFANHTGDLIGFRLHGQALRLLHTLDDGWEPYWRDTILVPSGKTLHAAFMATDPGRWVIESPFFDQATNGLRRWFEIL